ncbi:RICIN domain-containing protein [Clostridium sp. Marseille-Q2269]|uniref:metallophosphoesterase n=1 Tax=Clostridium sp. Marseille-Q2269 TaxID=2942205 RepID=UPI002073DBFC|nr:RICIN domain-containing protein [Clostridium sp. Marseille-Q2269]
MNTSSKSLSGRSDILYSLVITSDTNYPWTPEMDNYQSSTQSESDKERISENLIREQYHSINTYTDGMPNSSILMNGDITAFGHKWQWNKMNKLLKILKRPYYYGLGNHDIENNIDDCVGNGCFLQSMDYLVSFINRLKLPKSQVDFSLTRTSTTTRKSYLGSFSYAMDFGYIYSIQLNNFPTMKVKRNSPVSPHPGIDMFPNFKWIEDQLRYASNLGKIIIVNIHKPDEWNKFAHPSGPNQYFMDLLKQYDVTAVFCGHYHRECGNKTYRYSNYFNGIPVFLSGSASQRTYLIAEYNKNSLDVYSIRDNNLNNKKLEESISTGHKKPTGPYQIVTALNNDSVIDLNKANNNIILWGNHGGNNQKWMFVYNAEKKAYQIKSVWNDDLVIAWIIDTPYSLKVQAHRNEYKEEHYWILEDTENGYCIIRNYKNKNMVLDIDNGKTEKGTIIKLSPAGMTTSQIFKLTL